MSIKPPLASILRPKSIKEIIGQTHLIGEGMPISSMIKKDRITSFILFGPSGSGKTTISNVLANDTACDFKVLNATESKIADIRKVIELAETRLKNGTKTIVFIDEINRLTKNVQDVLLPGVEDGTIILIGATIEKPMFAINSALLSRMQVYETKPLSTADMVKVISKAVEHYNKEGVKFNIDGKETISLMINRCSGDARRLLTLIETLVEVLIDDGGTITVDHVNIAMPTKYFQYEKDGSGKFDYAHCYQESIQHSDVDAALYWLGKMIAAGELPEYISRRLMVSAVEDAPSNPFAVMAAMAADYIISRVGFPEGQIALAYATIEVCQSPRTKWANNAITDVMNDINNGVTVHVPPEMRAGAVHGSSYVAAVSKKYLKDYAVIYKDKLKTRDPLRNQFNNDPPPRNQVRSQPINNDDDPPF